jgi:Flp pilus assembly protein TadG
MRITRGARVRPARYVRGAAPVPGTRWESGCERGVSTIEVVILAPVIILFILVLVAFGQLVDGRGAVDGAARDAARAGSIQRSQSVAMDQATLAARADLDNTCVGGTVSVTQTSPGFAPDSLFTVEVRCTVRGLGSLGLDIRKTITSSASSPLDPFRRAVAD